MRKNEDTSRSLRAHTRSCSKQINDVTISSDVTKTQMEVISEVDGHGSPSKASNSNNHNQAQTHSVNEEIETSTEEYKTTLQHDRTIRNLEKVQKVENKPKLNVPKTTQDWQRLEETVEHTMPKFLELEDIETKFCKLNDFIYNIILFNFGLKDDEKTYNVKKKVKKRKDEENDLRAEKKRLKKELKSCSNEEEESENRKRLYKVLNYTTN